VLIIRDYIIHIIITMLFFSAGKEKYSESLIYYEKAYRAALNSGILFDQIDARYKMGLMNYYLKNFQVSSYLNDALKKQ
jgi:hypothetical protein